MTATRSLKPGKYQIEATFKDVSKRQEFLVESGKVTAVTVLLQPATLPALSVEAQASSVLGPAPLTVQFQVLVSGGVPPDIFVWDFGDLTPLGTGQSVSHTYPNPGTFAPFVTITDSADKPGLELLSSRSRQQHLLLRLEGPCSAIS